MSGYAQDEAAAFDRSRVCFEALVAKPAGPQTGGHTHAQLEELLHNGEGRELLRTLHQDRLDLQAGREQRQQVVDAEGAQRTRVERGHQRGLATVLGQVTVTRMAYRAPGAPNLYPMDAALSLPAGKHSYGLPSWPRSSRRGARSTRLATRSNGPPGSGSASGRSKPSPRLRPSMSRRSTPPGAPGRRPTTCW